MSTQRRSWCASAALLAREPRAPAALQSRQRFTRRARSRSQRGFSLAQIAAACPEAKATEVIEVLVAAGIDLAAADIYGMTALHSAADKDNAEVLAKMLETAAAAVVDKQDLDGNTALHYAAADGK